MTQEKPWIDYSHEMKLYHSQPMRWLLWTISTISLGLGIIGIFLPLLPTTPFILLAAFCYGRSSPRFYNLLMNHPRLGPPLRQWKEKRSVPRRAKLIAITMLALTLVPSALLFVPLLPVKIGLIAFGAGIALYLWRLPET